jgi:uncharacterized pyridoxal phosphate-containing UPF0001 family protein
MSDFDPAQARADILQRIAQSAKAAGRDPGEVRLTAVSKQQPWERVAAAVKAGQRVFGENRVQEAQERWSARRGEQSDLELRLIGPCRATRPPTPAPSST